MAGRQRQRQTKPNKRSRSDRRGFLTRMIHGVWAGLRYIAWLVWAFTVRVGIALALVLVVATGWTYATLPEATELFDGRTGGSVTLLDRQGTVFAWRGEQYGGEVSVGAASPHLVHAVVAAEDRRFFYHFGLDPRGIARAAWINFRAGHLVQGGSTLTQQVAKNVFLTAERSIDRKLLEVPMALALELKYSKDEILSIYLNRVYLGAGTYGFEAASQRYFGKSVRVLSPAEAAMLAGLLRAPSRYAPTRDLDAAQGRASVIVRLMEQEGYLSAAQVTDALANPARLSTSAAARVGGAFADWVMEEAPSYLTRQTSEDVVIRTTFDPEIQRAAEAAVAEIFATKVRDGSEAEAAVVVLSPDGAVRAMVGGRQSGAALFNRATQALRQPGSAFKPIVYAAAIEAGMRPSDIVVDGPVTLNGWSPSNYTNTFSGEVTLTEALAKSINTVAVKVGERTGQARVRAMARRMGIGPDLAPGPAIALGTSETRLIDLTGAYAVIANGGRQARPYGVNRIEIRGLESPIMERQTGEADSVMKSRTAGLLTGMMATVIERGTGARARLPDARPAAGKTGTTQRARDAWFVGFTADYVAGVWMGYDDNRPLSGVTGGGLPAEIWADVMTRIHKGLPVRPLDVARDKPNRRIRPDAVALGKAATTPDDTMLERILEDVIEGLKP